MTKSNLSRRKMLLGVAVATAAAPAMAWSKPSSAHSAPKLAGLDRTEERLLTSPDGQQFRIQIGHPHEVEDDLPLMIRGRKPVPVYVLDGGDNFGTVVGLSRMMQYGGSVPPCLIVGISYADAEAAEKGERRSLDLTPSPGGPDRGVRYGGAMQFRSFLAGRIKPMIEAEFTVDTDLPTLVGHSFGGLFALDTAVQQPRLFANVLALSPSLWFDNNLVLGGLMEALKNHAPFPQVVALAGDREQQITQADYNMTRNVEILDEEATAAGRSDKIFAHVLADTTHHTIQGAGFTFGLRKLLDPTPPSIEAGCIVT